MRSSSLLILTTATMKRRSLATGWYRARSLRHSSSTSTSTSSISMSAAITLRALVASRVSMAWTARRRFSSTRAPSARILRFSLSISRCRCVISWSFPRLS